MKQKLAAFALLLATGPWVTAAVTQLREDFSEPNPGDWGLFFEPIARLADGETVRTPLSDANNDTMGSWGGYYPVGASSQGGLFISGAELPGVLPPEGSLFGVGDPGSLVHGMVVFGAYPSPPDTTVFDETGGYLYTVFPSTPIGLTGGGRIQFDSFNGTLQSSSAIFIRVMLRVDDAGSPLWILSDPFPLTGVPQESAASPPSDGSAWTDMAAIDLVASALQWTEITAPSNAVLGSMQSGDGAPLALGSTVADPPLGVVTGFGLYLDTDIVRNDLYGVGIDAIRLINATTPVAQWRLYH